MPDNHFAMNPVKLDRPRAVFDRSFDHKFDAPTAALVPFYLDEVIPGDTARIKTDCFIRMHTLALAPMDELYCDVFYFFVPMRLVWEHTKQFFGEQDSPAWTENNSYSIPRITSSLANSIVTAATTRGHTLLSYMGVNVGYNDTDWSSSATDYNSYIARDLQKVSVLPFRAYKLIHHVWFRDENYMPASGPTLGDTAQSSDLEVVNAFGNHSNLAAWVDGSFESTGALFDYFTSILPGPQFGPAVHIPLGEGKIPVSSMSDKSTATGDTWTAPMTWKSYANSATGSALGTGTLATDSSARTIKVTGTPTSAGFAIPDNLWANLDKAASAVGATVNQIRWAFAAQRFYEADARGGAHRYHEIIKSHFGITNPDARMQIPEYLGGKRFVLNSDTVVSSAETQDASLGDIGGYSKTFDSVNGFSKSFTEYGYIIGVMTVRPKKTYFQGIPKLFTRKDKLDFYWPEFAYLGEQETKVYELFAGSKQNADEAVLGYNEFGAEYRYKPNQLSGSFRPTSADNSLAGFTYAHKFGDSTALASAARQYSYADVSDALVVTSNRYPFICDFRVSATWTREMPVYSVPGLVDHY